MIQSWYDPNREFCDLLQPYCLSSTESVMLVYNLSIVELTSLSSSATNWMSGCWVYNWHHHLVKYMRWSYIVSPVLRCRMNNMNTRMQHNMKQNRLLLHSNSI